MTDRSREVAGSAALLVLALLAGSVFGRAWIWIALALALIAGRHVFHLWRLADAMDRGEAFDGRAPGGMWRIVYRNAGKLRTRGRKRKRRLSRFLARFRDAAAALPDAAVVLGARGEIEWLNPAAERLLGLDPGRDTGRTLDGCVRDPGLRDYLASPDTGRWLDLRSPVDGARILSARAVPFGRKRQRLFVARDVTWRRVADDAAEDFVANVSHELRTPLTVITGYIEELSESTDGDGTRAGALGVMREQAAHMNDIVGDLLDYSRLQMETPDGDRGVVALQPLLDRIATDARELGARSGHVIRVEVDPSLSIDGAAKLLRSAFSNLVFNAVRHTPPRTEVLVRGWRDERGVHVQIADNGEGIAVRHVPRLTERFYRVDESRSRSTGGTGLGLAIVRRVLERYGGELQIESKVGAGSEFTCHFPAVEPVGAGEKEPPEDS